MLLITTFIYGHYSSRTHRSRCICACFLYFETHIVLREVKCYFLDKCSKLMLEQRHLLYVELVIGCDVNVIIVGWLSLHRHMELARQRWQVGQPIQYTFQHWFIGHIDTL